MKSKLFGLFFGFFVVVINGCISTHIGNIQPSSFSAGNSSFKIVKTIEGYAQADYIFCLGGNLINGLVNEAKKDMYSTYKFKANQNITNITTDIKQTFFLIPAIYSNKKVIITADVIEFYPDNQIKNELNINQVEIQKQNLIKADSISNPAVNIEVVTFNDSKLNEIKRSKNVKTMDNLNLFYVNINDYVSFESFSGEISYGRILAIKSKKYILVLLEPSPGNSVEVELEIKKCKKVISY